MAKQQQSETEETPEPNSLALGDVVGDPTEEELAPQEEPVAEPDPEGAATVEAGAGEPTPAVVEPGPDGAPEGSGEEDPDDIPVPEQGDDGKWRLGKYVADDLATLVQNVEKARRHAERAIGKKQAPVENTNPFLDPDDGDEDALDEFDGIDVFDESEIGSVFGASIAQALAQNGLIPQPQQPDPQQAAMQAVQVAHQAINNAHSLSDIDFEMTLQALVSHAPFDTQTRQQVLDAWGEVSPVKAAQEAAKIEFAFMQAAAQHEQAQAEAAALAAVEAEPEVVDTAAATREAQAAWAANNPDWVQYGKKIHEWTQANKALWDSVQGNKAAVYAALDAAHQYALSTSVAGTHTGVSNQDVTMQNVTIDPAQNPESLARAAAAEQRDTAGMEMGVSEDVQINVMSANPPGVAEVSTEDLLGMTLAQ